MMKGILLAVSAGVHPSLTIYFPKKVLLKMHAGTDFVATAAEIFCVNIDAESHVDAGEQ